MLEVYHQAQSGVSLLSQGSQHSEPQVSELACLKIFYKTKSKSKPNEKNKQNPWYRVLEERHLRLISSFHMNIRKCAHTPSQTVTSINI